MSCFLISLILEVYFSWESGPKSILIKLPRARFKFKLRSGACLSLFGNPTLNVISLNLSSYDREQKTKLSLNFALLASFSYHREKSNVKGAHDTCLQIDRYFK